MKIQYDFYCPDCEASYVHNEKLFECPHCGFEGVYSADFLICTCGHRVYLPNFSNYCMCGKIYNSFGQEVLPFNKWSDSDRLSFFEGENSET